MRVALITGAAHGLGAAICERLAADGFTVYAADIDDAGVTQLAQKLGDSVSPLSLDVRSEGSWRAALARIEERSNRLDVLVNNAGIVVTGNVETLDVESFRDALDVDLLGPFLGCKHAIPLMSRSGGSIVNLSSRAALRPNPELIGYSSAKAGLTMLTKSIALHCAAKGYDIRCNSIHPGLISTQKNDEIAGTLGDMEEVYAEWQSRIPLGRIGRPDEVAAMVSYLVSPEASFATGAQFVLDGGSSL